MVWALYTVLLTICVVMATIIESGFMHFELDDPVKHGIALIWLILVFAIGVEFFASIRTFNEERAERRRQSYRRKLDALGSPPPTTSRESRADRAFLRALLNRNRN